MSNQLAYHIRPAALTDFETIYNFINALEETVLEKDVLHNIFQKNIASALNIYLVACGQNGDVVGYISCHGQYLMHHAGLVGEIQELFVQADKRNEGVGMLLVNAVKAAARNKDMLQLEVTANNSRHATHQFYERQGFDQTHKKFVCPLTT